MILAICRSCAVYATGKKANGKVIMMVGDTTDNKGMSIIE
jgi:hypothetical protein